MKFNWILSNGANNSLQKQTIELEYQLRPRITRFLMEHLEQECSGDFSCFYFDVDVEQQWIWISKKTPQDYIDRIKEDFDLEINGSHLFSVA